MTTAQELVLQQSLGEYYAARANADERKAATAIDDLRARIQNVPGIAELVETEKVRLSAINRKDLGRRCHISAVQLQALNLATGVAP
jgi:hypothetical protein